MIEGLSARQQEIFDLARDVGRVSVEDLAARFDVTPQTIRRDLNDLSDRRLLARIHGGAVIDSGVNNLSYEARQFVAEEAKRAIGAAAAALIPDRCSLFINIGTTTEEVCKSLVAHKNLLVITNNLNVAMQLHRLQTVDVVVAGGMVRKSDGAVTGEAAVHLIKQFCVDTAIIGASAIDETGALLDFDYQEVRVAQAIIENARRVMLVCDHSKIGRAAPVRLAHFSQIHTFVTDILPPGKLRTFCETQGIQLVEALPHSPMANNL